jgi:hypothetical protein
MWKPVTQASGSLDYALKRAISRKLWDTDGSIGIGVALVNCKDIPYLEGLRDAGVDGADELIELINEHGALELWHEH